MEHIEELLQKAPEVSIEHNFDRENENGNIEYKWRLINISQERIVHLTTQMKCRLQALFLYRKGTEKHSTKLESRMMEIY